MEILIALLAFASGASLLLGLTAPSSRRVGLSQRLDFIRNPQAAPDTLLPEDRLHHSFTERFLTPFLRTLAGWVWRRTPDGIADTIRVQLKQAGSPKGWGIPEVLGARVLSLAVCALVGVLAFGLPAVTPLGKLIWVTACLLTGATLPQALLQQRIRERQDAIRRRLPETLDLLLVTLEAGLGFDQAWARVADKSAGPLADEMRHARSAVGLGMGRREALKEMAGRVGLPELSAVVAAICQADQRGLGLSDVLRVQCEMQRALRAQRLREEAAQLPTKMLFPLVFFIFPALLVILLGPSLLTLLRLFGGH